MNYECLGNGDGGAHIHWHLFPRRAGDIGDYGNNGRGPVWCYPMDKMYSDDNRPDNRELEDMKTSKAKHLMIFGGSDPWRSQAGPEEITNGNENIRRYINPDYPHDAKIANMPEDMKNEVISLHSRFCMSYENRPCMSES